MKVRILSGNQTGQVVEMEQTEAEVNISIGYVVAIVDEPGSVIPAGMSVSFPEPEPKPEPAPELAPRLGRKRSE